MSGHGDDGAARLRDAVLLTEMMCARMEEVFGTDLRPRTAFKAEKFLKQFQRLSDRVQTIETPVLRTIHHFACTGGTLISRCIGAMPNTQVLSEIDPLSPLATKGSFTPADLVSLARLSSRPTARNEDLIEIFLAGLGALCEQDRRRGTSLVLREHSHSHLCTGDLPVDRPPLHEILQQHYALLSLITVRHPLDSFLSLRQNQWVHFAPGTIEEYARRYDAFLEAHAGVEIIRYEDFLAAPAAVMRHICERLRLVFNPDFGDLFIAVKLSGDSGRKGDTIAPRPRRPIPEALQAEVLQSAAYVGLCDRLGYDPDPSAESCLVTSLGAGLWAGAVK
jgi:hypothetical protein